MARIQNANRRSDLLLRFGGRRAGTSFLDIEAWMPSEIKAVSPLVDRLMRLIGGSHCVAGEEPFVELAIEEALNNAVVHGNRMDPQKLVRIRCHCDPGKGISLLIKDEEQGFAPNHFPNPLKSQNLSSAHRRDTCLTIRTLHQLTFQPPGTEVHI